MSKLLQYQRLAEPLLPVAVDWLLPRPLPPWPKSIPQQGGAVEPFTAALASTPFEWMVASPVPARLTTRLAMASEVFGGVIWAATSAPAAPLWGRAFVDAATDCPYVDAATDPLAVDAVSESPYVEAD